MGSAAKGFWTVAFSGAGHLLPYHLGAATSILSWDHASKIRAVAGSSSGAIAASLVALLPDQIEDFSHRFLSDGGRGLTNFKEILRASEESHKSTTSAGPTLYICTTRSHTGNMYLFEFDSKSAFAKDSKLFDAIHASCMIPKSFHPYDVFSRSPVSYPDGIDIDGKLYCDGGIAAPAPPTPFDLDEDCAMNIVVSPISGSSRFGIRPEDKSFALPFQLTARCGSFHVRPSLQNLRAAIASLGASPPETLKDWYRRGAEDAQRFLDSIQ